MSSLEDMESFLCLLFRLAPLPLDELLDEELPLDRFLFDLVGSGSSGKYGSSSEAIDSFPEESSFSFFIGMSGTAGGTTSTGFMGDNFSDRALDICRSFLFNNFLFL